MLANSGKSPPKRAGRSRDQDGALCSPQIAAGLRLRHCLVEPVVAAPPTRTIEHRMVIDTLSRERACRLCQSGWSRFPAADVEHARLVHLIGARKQAVPINSSKQRPNRNGAHICACAAKRACRAPDHHEPPQLLITRAAVVHFRHGYGASIPRPRLAQWCKRANLEIRQVHPDRLDVRVPLAPVSPMMIIGVRGEAFVEVAIAREVMIDPDEIGGSLAAQKSREDGLSSR